MKNTASAMDESRSRLIDARIGELNDWRGKTKPMRLSAHTATNTIAWAMLIGLIGIAFVTVVILGPFGLILLGLMALFVCTSVQLREDIPVTSIEVFKARTQSRTSPELRAAMAEDRQRLFAPLRFYRGCGAALLLAGIAGFAWQILR